MKPEDAALQPVEILYEARFLRLVRQGSWEYTERHRVSGIVALVPVTDAGEIVLVEQFRVPCGRRVVELCAGLAGDVPGQEEEPLEAAAARELEEECGYRAASVTRLSAGPNAAGSSNSVITFFLATGLTRVGDGGGDETEDIQVHVVPLAGAAAWLAAQEASGKMIDPKIYAGLWFAERSRQRPQGGPA
jgi:ADP-ribose pyrophosphatase